MGGEHAIVHMVYRAKKDALAAAAQGHCRHAQYHTCHHQSSYRLLHLFSSLIFTFCFGSDIKCYCQ